MSPDTPLEKTDLPEDGTPARAFLRTAGQMDSCGSGLLVFGQLEPSGSLRTFSRPTEFTPTLKNLFFLLRPSASEPPTSFERETAQTFAPIFRSPHFQSSGLTMAYNMAQATRLDVHLSRDLTRPDHRLEPPPAQFPGDCPGIRQPGQRGLGLGSPLSVQAPGPPSDPVP